MSVLEYVRRCRTQCGKACCRSASTQKLSSQDNVWTWPEHLSSVRKVQLPRKRLEAQQCRSVDAMKSISGGTNLVVRKYNFETTDGVFLGTFQIANRAGRG
jgi:hypothetical protein